jgi:protein-S-isoprenylcysteine O-methyltransferase Ste14
MSEEELFRALVMLSFPLAGVTFAALFFINAPYGRHIRKGWGPTLPNHHGWLIMEMPAALLFAVFFFAGSPQWNLTRFIFFGMWEAHYLYRAFIYPFRIADRSKKMPLLILLMAIGFNIGNAYLNGRYLFSLAGDYPVTWLFDPRFIIGLVLFVSGYAIHRQSDLILRDLRAQGENDYKIPYAGLFNRVSCPNYLGEIIEWAGWALATWSLPGLSFAVWTIANLAPRAHANHEWYRTNFTDYPERRKALIPGIW